VLASSINMQRKSCCNAEIVDNTVEVVLVGRNASCADVVKLLLRRSARLLARRRCESCEVINFPIATKRLYSSTGNARY
jgi:hypothetical protein